MKIKQLFQHLENLYDFKNQPDWDCSGMISHHHLDLQNIIICLDITNEVINLAQQYKSNLIISHHPLFTVDSEKANLHSREFLNTLKVNKISVIYLHIPFDRSEHGLNFVLAKQLQLNNIHFGNEQHDYVIGNLTKPTLLNQLAIRLKHCWKQDHIRYLSGYKNKQITNIAICSGSGAGLIYELSGADLFITGDIKYHAWVDSITLAQPLLEINHDIENGFIDIIAEQILNITKKIKLIKHVSKIKYEIIL